MKLVLVIIAVLLSSCVHLGQLSKEEQKCVNCISSGNNFLFNETEASAVCQCVTKAQPNSSKVAACYSEVIDKRKSDQEFMNKFNFVAGCIEELRQFFANDNQTFVGCTCIGDKVFNQKQDISDQLLFECQMQGINFFNEGNENAK